MEQIRVLIADDDDGMRLVLRRLIEREEGFALVAEAKSGLQAVELAAETSPDVAFLDIDMPDISGLAAARAICSGNNEIAIIFATAHAEYMPDAFELYAYDYLLKPFDVGRVRRTLKRLRTRRGADPGEAPSSTRSGRLTIRSREGIHFVEPDAILFIERVERDSILVTTQGEITTSESLSELEERLDPDTFMRTHRSFLVNTRRVLRATPYGRWSYTLHFKDCARTAMITSEKLEEL